MILSAEINLRRLFCAGLAGFLFLDSSLAESTNLPTTLSELNRWYQEPAAGQNGATRFLDGIAALRITEADETSTNLPLVGKGERPLGDASLPPPMEAAIHDFVQRNRSALSLLRGAGKFQHFRYPIDLNQGQAVLLPHLRKMRQASHALVLSSLSNLLVGRGNEAREDLEAAFALARSLESEPVLVSQVVRVSCNLVAVTGVEQLFNRAALPWESCAQFQKVIEQLEQREAAGFGFTRAFIGEQVTDLSLFAMSPEDYLVPPRNATPEERQRLKPRIEETLAADRQHCEAAFARAMALRRQPFPQRLAQDAIFVSASAVATNNHWRLGCILLPGLGMAATREAQNLALLRLCVTATALERFRVSHTNRYPETLNELRPEYAGAIPQDPFDGAPLRYRKRGTGYLLYSIGRDLKDNGGRRVKNEDGDIVFEVVNPPKVKR